MSHALYTFLETPYVMRTTVTITPKPTADPKPAECLPMPIPATLRPGYVLPTPPAPGWFPVVTDTGDGWCTSWEGPDGEEGDLIVGDEFGWPFVEDTARAADWERAGWVVL